MGGGVSISLPLNKAHRDTLGEKYKAMSSEMDDQEIQNKLDLELPSIVLFDQIDCDHSGLVSKLEVKRMLKCLPQADHLSPDELMPHLDTDKNGEISMDEWLRNLRKPELAPLKLAIDGGVNKATGLIANYKSLEMHLEELVHQKEEIMDGIRELEHEKEHVMNKITKMRELIGSAGKIVFRQIDLDHNGMISKNELLRVLNHMSDLGIMKHDFDLAMMPVEEVLSKIDVNGDGKLSEAEWLASLDNVPGLNECVEKSVDMETGRIKGYKTLEDELSEGMKEIQRLEKMKQEGEGEGVDEQRLGMLKEKSGSIAKALFGALRVPGRHLLDEKFVDEFVEQEVTPGALSQALSQASK